ncbi:MAG: hypothetical protein CSA81_11955 [Acidobacteria bacterium]|nr:MAG: hypothetical protein CSA81_11955 [Acidobacteriota bacterium]
MTVLFKPPHTRKFPVNSSCGIFLPVLHFSRTAGKSKHNPKRPQSPSGKLMANPITFCMRIAQGPEQTAFLSKADHAADQAVMTK